MPNEKNYIIHDKLNINFIVNEKEINITVPATYTLLDILRYELKLTGTKEGCGMGECGACTVIMDNSLVTSCLVLASTLNGRNILTIEGISEKKEAKVIIEEFIKHAAIQCGFCTPGMIVSAYHLLSNNSMPTDEEIKKALSGNLCRCTGYTKIIDAIKSAALILSKNKKENFKNA